MDLIKQLNRVYYEEETWHKFKISEEEITKYHERLLSSGNIICEFNESDLIGYVEFWRINYEQFGRIICQEPFSAYLENILDGNIAYVANAWIAKQYRSSSTYKKLKLLFLERNFMCDYFVGEARRKKSAPIKVFKRNQLSSIIKE